MSPLPPPIDEQSGPHPTIPPAFMLDRAAPVQSRFGEILALVGFAFALGGVAVRSEVRSDRQGEQIVKLEEFKAKVEAQATPDALWKQDVKSDLSSIKKKLRIRDEVER